ncbi:MAG TPA: helix-turn-helix domain-containing protein [Candidatus Paceibacterota bacterium]
MIRKKHSSSLCPIAKTAKILSDTWTMLIMRDVIAGPRRFCELERSLEGISTRTLTLKLKQLEGDAMIKKTKDGAYGATAKGKALQGVERAMKKYGEKYL